MKKKTLKVLFIGICLYHTQLFGTPKILAESFSWISGIIEVELKEEAFAILNSKCNVCHKKQNPFKVFSLKNMDKHALKIYKQVFIYQRMPKGDNIKLTAQEYQILKTWLQSQNIK